MKKIKVQIQSDLHIEFERGYQFQDAGADIIVFAGDAGQGCTGVHWINEQAPSDRPVIYVCGNHEFYDNVHPAVINNIHRTAKPNVHFLNDDELIIDELGVRVLGATLWTDFGVYGNVLTGKSAAQAYLNDYRMIYVPDLADELVSEYDGLYDGIRTLRPDDTEKWHQASMAFLNDARPFEGKTIVVTHHAPSAKSIQAKYGIDNPVNAAYASNLEHLMGSNIDAWIHGHMHSTFDYEVNGTRVVCNPKGYRNENPDFDPQLLIEV